MPPMPAGTTVPLERVFQAERIKPGMGQIIDIRVKPRPDDLVLLGWQGQISCLPERLQATQGSVFAAMGIAGQLIEKLGRLRPVPVDMGKPAQLTGGGSDLGVLEISHTISMASFRAPTKAR